MMAERKRIVGRIERSGRSSQGLRLEAWDRDLVFDDFIGEAVTVEDGRFVIEFDEARYADLVESRPDVFFRIYEADRLLLTTGVQWSWQASERDLVLAVRGAARRPAPSLASVAERLNLPADRMEALQAAGLKDAGDLFTTTGVQALEKMKLPTEEHRRVLTAGRFAAIADDASLGAALVDAGVTSFVRLARIPPRELERRLKTGPAQRRSLLAVHRAARQVARRATHMMINSKLLDGRGGSWHTGKKGGQAKNSQPCTECSCCDNVFSPRAYLFDLLDVLFHWWNVTTDELGPLLRQAVLEDMLQPNPQSTCDSAFAPVAQVRLGVEVLERFLEARDPANLPLDEASWSRSFLAGVATFLGVPPATLASYADGDLDDFITDHLEPLPPSLTSRGVDAAALLRPRLAALDQVMAGVREIVAARAGDAAGARVDAAVGPLLATYRSALIEASGIEPAALEDRLFIDLHGGPCLTTTRITQLINSIQSLILAIRTGEIATLDRDDLPPARTDFTTLQPVAVEENAWRWLGSYETWASAMYAVVYTENVLPPPVAVENFRPFVSELLSNPTPMKVRQAFVAYQAPANLRYLDTDAMTHTEIQRLGRMRTMMEGAPQMELGRWVTEMRTTVRVLLPLVTDGARELVRRDTVERDLLFPLLAAWALNRAGEYAAAHDWYRLLYDPFKAGAERYAFPFGTHFWRDEVRPDDWLEDALDPHAIARRREGVYLRHTIIMMVRNLIDWADHEYGLENPESIDRARDLYRLTARILQAPDLGECFQQIHGLALEIVKEIRTDARRVTPDLWTSLDRLYGINGGAALGSAVAGIRNEARTGGVSGLPARINTIVDGVRPTESGRFTQLGRDLEGRRNRLGRFEEMLLSGSGPRPDLPPDGGGGRPVPDGGGGRPVPDGGGPIPDPGGGPGGGGRPIPEPDDGRFIPFPWDELRDRPVDEVDVPEPGLTTGDVEFVDVPVYLSATFCVPSNPLLTGLDAVIRVNLLKLSYCLGISGEPLPRSSYTCGSAMEYVGALAGQSLQGSAAAAVFLPSGPPRYRYGFLVDRARQYADVAQRLGSALLQALEKRDEERYRSLLASHALGLADARLALRDIGVREAQVARRTATLQLDRALVQDEFWAARIAGGMMSDREELGLNLMWASAWLQGASAAVSAASILPIAAAAGIGTGVTIAGGAATATGVLAEVGIPISAAGLVMLGGSAAAAAAAGPAIAAALGSAAATTSAFAQANLTLASFERRFEDWTLQSDLAAIDYDIAESQLSGAVIRVEFARQERQIASLEHAQAREVLSFLENKFSNEELYAWMIDVLSREYRSVMQLAAATARQAQYALEFERQEPVHIIAGDYWSVEGAAASAFALTDAQRSRGLLGAERLTADLVKLDSYKTHTERRRLQLTRTISMARMMPAELLHLRTTGSVTFNTLLRWFDEDFAGHYLRLIRSVKVSVIALVPPADGIRAMLRNGGESTVVVKDGIDAEGRPVFVRRRSMRTFGEEVALDSPFNDSGLFVLDPQDPLLLPFEGLGVETQWTFELPRSSNTLNFDTLVDVLFTIEYTAAADADHAEQVRAALGTTFVSDTLVDTRSGFPDAWYHLQNPVDASQPQVLRLPTSRVRFAPNYRMPDALKTLHATVVLLGALQADEAALRAGITVGKDGLTLSPASPATAGSQAFPTTTFGPHSVFLSTRTQGGTAAAVAPAVDPVGDWTVTLAPALFAGPSPVIERIQNILLIVTVEGVRA